MTAFNDDFAFVHEHDAVVNGNYCCVMGDNCTINGNNCVVYGKNCILKGNNNVYQQPARGILGNNNRQLSSVEMERAHKALEARHEQQQRQTLSELRIRGEALDRAAVAEGRVLPPPPPADNDPYGTRPRNAVVVSSAPIDADAAIRRVAANMIYGFRGASDAASRAAAEYRHRQRQDEARQQQEEAMRAREAARVLVAEHERRQLVQAEREEAAQYLQGREGANVFAAERQRREISDDEFQQDAAIVSGSVSPSRVVALGLQPLRSLPATTTVTVPEAPAAPRPRREISDEEFEQMRREGDAEYERHMLLQQMEEEHQRRQREREEADRYFERLRQEAIESRAQQEVRELVDEYYLSASGTRLLHHLPAASSSATISVPDAPATPEPSAKDNEPTCSVCIDHVIKTVCQPCGHACMCVTCARELVSKNGRTSKCPICRKALTSIGMMFIASASLVPE
jgi:hypothetical protein